MTMTMDELRDQHQVLLDLVEDTEESSLLPKVHEFLDWLSHAGAEVDNARQRSQLRGLIRFWSSFIYDQTGQFPDVQLLPAVERTAAPEVQQPQGLAVEDALLVKLVDRIVELVQDEDKADKFFENLATLRTREHEPTPLRSHAQLGPYQIIEEIGQGGFSKVYKALDTTTERLVALKVLQGEQFQRSPRFREQLIAREKIVAELDHPHIIPIYSVAEYDGIPCIAMKLIESGSLADRLAHWYWRPTVRDLLEIAHQAVEGLAYLHDKGIVHRDIKPANILISFDNQVYLTDFGIAQVMESAFKGMIVGTPEYLAPEAILHPDSVDGRADLYSLGIVLFEMFTGRLPFQAESTAELLHLQVNQLAPLMFGVSSEICTAVNRCLQKEPDERFQNATEFRLQIEALLSSLPETELNKRLSHFTSAPSRRKTLRKTWVIRASEILPTAAMSPAKVICPWCGTSNRQGAIFCITCGKRISAFQPTSSRVHFAPSPPPHPPGGKRISAFQPTSSLTQRRSNDTVLTAERRYPPKQAVLAILVARSDLPNADHFVIRRAYATIGRGRYNDIVINDQSISRQHALLVYEKGKGKRGTFTLYDLASANGILVNAKPVHVRRRLKHNDLITLGKVELLFKRLDDNPKPVVTEENNKHREGMSDLEADTPDTD